MRLPSTTALAVALAVLALSLGAGAFGSADLGRTPADEDEQLTPSGNERNGPSVPAEPNTPDGGASEGCGLLCSLPTARSLLGAVFAPLTPVVVAGIVLLGGVLALVVGRERRASEATHEESASDDPPVGPEAPGNAATGADRGYSTPAGNTVTRGFRTLRTASGITDPETRTAREVRRAAVESGHDRGAATTVVESFEAVRYGGVAPTEREREVGEALAELELDKRIERDVGGEK